jgi:hypothetical protein
VESRRQWRLQSGSEGGPEKPTSRKVDRALRSDPYAYVSTWAGRAYVCFIVACSQGR